MNLVVRVFRAPLQLRFCLLLRFNALDSVSNPSSGPSAFHLTFGPTSDPFPSAGQLFRSREGRSVEYSIRPSVGEFSSFPLATSENPSKQ